MYLVKKVVQLRKQQLYGENEKSGKGHMQIKDLQTPKLISGRNGVGASPTLVGDFLDALYNLESIQICF